MSHQVHGLVHEVKDEVTQWLGTPLRSFTSSAGRRGKGLPMWTPIKNRDDFAVMFREHLQKEHQFFGSLIKGSNSKPNYKTLAKNRRTNLQTWWFLKIPSIQKCSPKFRLSSGIYKVKHTCSFDHELFETKEWINPINLGQTSLEWARKSLCEMDWWSSSNSWHGLLCNHLISIEFIQLLTMAHLTKSRNSSSFSRAVSTSKGRTSWISSLWQALPQVERMLPPVSTNQS